MTDNFWCACEDWTNGLLWCSTVSNLFADTRGFVNTICGTKLCEMPKNKQTNMYRCDLTGRPYMTCIDCPYHVH